MRVVVPCQRPWLTGSSVLELSEAPGEVRHVQLIHWRIAGISVRSGEAESWPEERHTLAALDELRRGAVLNRLIAVGQGVASRHPTARLASRAETHRRQTGRSWPYHPSRAGIRATVPTHRPTRADSSQNLLSAFVSRDAANAPRAAHPTKRGEPRTRARECVRRLCTRGDSGWICRLTDWALSCVAQAADSR